MKFEPDGNVTSFGKLMQFTHTVCNTFKGDLTEMSFCTVEKKKTELYQELGLLARDLRFQHLTSVTSRNNAIIIRMEV